MTIDVEPGDHEVALRHDGRDRRYLLHVPESPPPGPLPVVMVLHGGGGRAQQVRDDIGMDRLADRDGFLAVYPDGTGPLPARLHTWNAGDRCCGSALRQAVDDVGFLRAVVRDLLDTTPADADRIYVTGHSNGAMMTYRFASEASDLVAAIAPVGGAAHGGDTPTEPLPLLHIHSVDDPRALYDGGEGPPFPGTDHTVDHHPVSTGLQAWAEANGCTGQGQVEPGSERFDTAGHTAALLVWSGCAAPVTHLRLSGAGHGWPGADVGRDAIIGPNTTIIDASEEVWTFVSQFERS